jgi:hypothetical protein
VGFDIPTDAGHGQDSFVIVEALINRVEPST